MLTILPDKWILRKKIAYYLYHLYIRITKCNATLNWHYEIKYYSDL